MVYYLTPVIQLQRSRLKQNKISETISNTNICLTFPYLSLSLTYVQENSLPTISVLRTGCLYSLFEISPKMVFCVFYFKSPTGLRCSYTICVIRAIIVIWSEFTSYCYVAQLVNCIQNINN